MIIEEITEAFFNYIGKKLVYICIDFTPLQVFILLVFMFTFYFLAMSFIYRED